jgi:prepilin-type N-terminal cleavage/methylation domain-containing protein
MKKSNGFTLVEVIVSLGVLGIIAIAFLGAIASHFTYMTSTKRITQNAFKAQELMEYEIDEAKIRVKTADPATLKKVKIFTSDLGGIDVNYEEVKITYNNKDYYTLISNIKTEPLEMISLESIGIKLMQGATQIQGDFYGYATDEFSVVGSFSNDNLYKWDHLLNQVEWYISSDKFNIPLPKNQSAVLNDDEGHYYPLFPRDYAIFSNETIYKFGSSETTFPYLEDIGGRHLVFSVIPAAKSGKLGVRLSSKPIYISGLPVTDNLITHLDASYIDVLSDTTEALLSGTEYLLKVWYDISSIHGLSAPSESAVSPNNYTFRPFVYRTDVDDPFSGQYVKFDSGKYVQINQGSSGGQVTVYAALRNRSDDASAYLVNGANALSIELPVVEGSYEWSIIRSNLTLDGNGFRIGDSKTDIAELIIYSGSLSDEDNSKVLDYLSRKYSTISIILNE